MFHIFNNNIMPLLKAYDYVRSFVKFIYYFKHLLRVYGSFRLQFNFQLQTILGQSKVSNYDQPLKNIFQTMLQTTSVTSI